MLKAQLVEIRVGEYNFLDVFQDLFAVGGLQRLHRGRFVLRVSEGDQSGSLLLVEAALGARVTHGLLQQLRRTLMIRWLAVPAAVTI